MHSQLIERYPFFNATDIENATRSARFRRYSLMFVVSYALHCARERVNIHSHFYKRWRFYRSINLPGPSTHWLWGNLQMPWWSAKPLTVFNREQIPKWTKVGK